MHFKKLNTGYQPAKFQIFRLSRSSFMEVGMRHQKHHYDVISYRWISKLAHLMEYIVGYQPFRFQSSGLSGSNFIEGVESTPNPMLQRDKKAQCL